MNTALLKETPPLTYPSEPPRQPSFTPTSQATAPGWAPPGPPPPPRRKRHWLRNSFLAIATFIVVLIIVSVARGGGGGGSTAGNTPAATQPAASAPAAAAAKAASAGTPVRDGKFQFTVTSVTQAKSAGDTANGLGDTAQGEYTILHVTVTNIGSQPQTLDDSSQYLYDASGRKYNASSAADMDLNSTGGSDSVFLNDINPGNTVQGQLAFDMPAGVKAVKAELHDSPFSGGIPVALP